MRVVEASWSDLSAWQVLDKNGRNHFSKVHAIQTALKLL
jgi:hypothetical protein